MAARAAGYLLILAALWIPRSLPAQGSKSDPTQVLRNFRFVATGANGQAVTDLRPEEIQVTDEGKRHALVFSRLLPAVSAAALLPGKSAAVTLNPREYSNLANAAGPSSVLILLDLLNANLTERGAAWNETVRALANPESPESIFVFLLTPATNLYAVHSWPGSGPAADDAPKPWTKQVRPLLDQALRVVEGIKSAEFTVPGVAVAPTYQALTTLGRLFAAVPGQKRIIWVTHGTPLTVATDTGPYDFTPQLKQVAAGLNQLGIALYTVHQQDRSTSGVDSQETLQTLPGLTGGRWFENDSIGPALKQAQADAGGTYRAGYYTPLKEADGKSHKLRVSTTRKGVKLLAAEEYTAAAPDEIVKANLEVVKARALDTPDIGLRADFDKSGEATRFRIRVDPRDLLLQPKDRPYTGSVSLIFSYLSAEGFEVGSSTVNVAVNMDQSQFDAAVKDGYPITVEKTVPPDARKIRILAQDPATGLAGSLSLPAVSSP